VARSLVAPGNPEALAEGIHGLYRDPGLAARLASAGRRDVEQFDAPRVAAAFLSEIAKVAPGLGRESDMRTSPGRCLLAGKVGDA
jgi:hypothetical protein